MVQRFISFYPMAYPSCRVESVINPKGDTKECFATFDDAVLGDDVRYYTTYVISNGKIEKYIDMFRTGECTNDSCQLRKKVLYCRFSIGDLSDDEVTLFNKKSDIANHPDFVLQNEAGIPLDSPEERYEHQEALNRAKKQFDQYRRNSRYDSDTRYMVELQEIADTIIASHGMSHPNPPLVQSTASPIDYSPPIFTVAAGKGNPKSAITAYNESIEWADDPANVIVRNEEPIPVRDMGVAGDVLWALQMSQHPNEKFKHWALSKAGVGHTDIAKSEDPKLAERIGEEEAKKQWASDGDKIRMQVRSVENMLAKREQS